MGPQFHVLHARWQLGSSNVRLLSAVDTLDSGELEVQTSIGAKMRADEATRIKRNTPQLQRDIGEYVGTWSFRFGRIEAGRIPARNIRQS
jgi:hypothetical protein